MKNKLKTDFEREKSWWNEKAPKEEELLNDHEINKALRWREIERHLTNVKTILCIGGGTGVFSVPLAKRGFQVTHVDISPAMISIAKKKAKNIKNLQFVEANSIDLSCFKNKAFDLVLNMDGAISFCGSEAEKAVLECCRLTKKKVVLAVSHRAWMIPIWIETSLQVLSKIMAADYEMIDNGKWHQDQFVDNPKLSKGCEQDYFGAFKAFLPEELENCLKKANMNVLRIGGIGSLANFCGQKVVDKVSENKKLFEEFLDLCEKYDKEILPNGPGTKNRAGLIAVAEPE